LRANTDDCGSSAVLVTTSSGGAAGSIQKIESSGIPTRSSAKRSDSASIRRRVRQNFGLKFTRTKGGRASGRQPGGVVGVQEEGPAFFGPTQGSTGFESRAAVHGQGSILSKAGRGVSLIFGRRNFVQTGIYETTRALRAALRCYCVPRHGVPGNKTRSSTSTAWFPTAQGLEQIGPVFPVHGGPTTPADQSDVGWQRLSPTFVSAAFPAPRAAAGISRHARIMLQGPSTRLCAVPGCFPGGIGRPIRQRISRLMVPRPAVSTAGSVSMRPGRRISDFRRARQSSATRV